MHGAHDIPDIIFRYRKRKQVSLDGQTPGLEYGRMRRGHTPPSSTGHASQVNCDEYDVLNDAKAYEPGRMFYSSAGPHYRRPTPWHKRSFEETPPIRYSSPPDPLPPPEPEISHDLAGWLLRRFVNEVSDARASGTLPDQDAADIQHLFDPHRTVRLKIGEIHEHMAAMRAYEESVLAGEMIDQAQGGYLGERSASDLWASAVSEAEAGLQKLADVLDAVDIVPDDPSQLEAGHLEDPFEAAEQAFDQGMDQMGATLDAPDQQQAVNLEEIIQQEMQEVDPYEMMDPYHALGPYGPMPDPRMMGMPMDPFGLM